MTEFIIEQGIPVPPKAVYKPEKYPFSLMKKGDSFQFELKNSKTHQQVISCAIRYRRAILKATGTVVEFKIRTLPDKKTARIWRVK